MPRCLFTGPSYSSDSRFCCTRLLLPSAHHADNAETSRVAVLQQSKPQCRLPKKIIYSEFYHLRQRAKIGSLRSSQKQASVQPMYQLHRRYIAVMCRLFTRRRRRRWVIPTATAAALRRWQRIINGWWYFDRQCIVRLFSAICSVCFGNYGQQMKRLMWIGNGFKSRTSSRLHSDYKNNLTAW